VTRRIAIIVERATEKAFEQPLRDYLSKHLSGQMPRLKFISEDGRIPTGEKLQRDVPRLLEQHFDTVIALTDVYTGTTPPQFINAADAKQKMLEWVGEEPRFHPHAAQFEFEAWLLPYWSTIQQLAGSDRGSPSPHPESVNHDRPPTTHLRELFRTGTKRRAYSKTRDGAAILRGQDLDVSAARCPELQAFLDTILREATAR
jgi:hypothetical protein